MPIVQADLILYSAASMPSDDTSTSGGAISAVSRPELTQWTANAVGTVQSDGADVRTVTFTGRLPSGIIDTEIVTANGATEVAGVKVFERMLSAVASATSATRVLTIRQGLAGTIRATISLNETTRIINFRDSTSESGATLRYEKGFEKNTHATLALTSAAVKLTADPSANVKIGLAATKGDTATTTNRKTAPAGITFVDDNVSQSVPTGNLAAGEAIGVWVEFALDASEAPVRSTYSLELTGSTTT